LIVELAPDIFKSASLSIIGLSIGLSSAAIYLIEKQVKNLIQKSTQPVKVIKC